MGAEGARGLFVPMDEILDAMDTHGEGAPSFFLDTRSGQVSLWIDPLVTGEENDFDPDQDDHFARIPTFASRDEHAAMQAFAAALEEADVRAQLERALRGRRPFQRFRDTLAGYPDLEVGWQREKRDLLLAQALAWLKDLGIEPLYELRPIAPSGPAGAGQRAADAKRPGLIDLLLLGAPRGKAGLVDGRVERRLRAGDPHRARAIFATVARQLCEHHGLAWRRRFIEDTDRYEVERFVLSVSGATVTLSVAVPDAIWAAFNPTSSSEE
jgi:hypothetical protein